MRILFIAPQPFFENRGTPIAVRNMLRTIGRLGHKTDLVAYHAGEDIRIPATTVYRCARLPFRSIPIGFSPLKLLLDALTYAVVVRRLMTRRYNVIHSVEEGVFLALLAPFRKNALLCYDMDSSLTEQLLARGKLWQILAPFLHCSRNGLSANPLASSLSVPPSATTSEASSQKSRSSRSKTRRSFALSLFPPDEKRNLEKSYPSADERPSCTSGISRLIRGLIYSSARSHLS